MPTKKPAGLVVLISGLGRNLQAIITAQQEQRLNTDILAVISNRKNAPGLEFARNAGIPTRVLRPLKGSDREAYDSRLVSIINEYEPDIVALAGFMRILSSGFVQQFSGKLVNIHPSLLPKYRGLDTHRRALAAGDPRHGASVHFVTADLDAGPSLLQGSIEVATSDTAESLASTVMQQVETRIYPQALEWIASGRAQMQGGQIEFDGHVLEAPIHEDCSKKPAE